MKILLSFPELQPRQKINKFGKRSCIKILSNQVVIQGSSEVDLGLLQHPRWSAL